MAEVRSDGPLKRMALATGLDPAIRRLVGSLAAVETEEPLLSVTFDDGPHPEVTPSVLAALSDHRAPATFFVLTERAERHPELIRAVLEEGHEIGLHGHSHLRLTRASPSRLLEEVRRARDRLRAITGREVRWFRPPYGVQNLRSHLLARACGMQVVLWSVECPDWLPMEVEEQLAFARPNLRPGRILLLHDVPPEQGEQDGGTVKERLTRAFLAEIADRGMRPVSLSRLVERGRPVRKVSLGFRRESAR